MNHLRFFIATLVLCVFCAPVSSASDIFTVQQTSSTYSSSPLVIQVQNTGEDSLVIESITILPSIPASIVHLFQQNSRSLTIRRIGLTGSAIACNEIMPPYSFQSMSFFFENKPTGKVTIRLILRAKHGERFIETYDYEM